MDVILRWMCRWEGHTRRCGEEGVFSSHQVKRAPFGEPDGVVRAVEGPCALLRASGGRLNNMRLPLFLNDSAGTVANALPDYVAVAKPLVPILGQIGGLRTEGASDDVVSALVSMLLEKNGR